MQRSKYVLIFVRFSFFIFLSSPPHYIFLRGEAALSWKVTFAGGQADGGSHTQAQFSSLTMCHSEVLKISMLETPGPLLNLGHWQHKDLLQAPMCDTGPPRTTHHPRDTAIATSAPCNWKIWASGVVFIMVVIITVAISCSAPEVLVSLARVSWQRQPQDWKDCPQLFHRQWLYVFFIFPLKKKINKSKNKRDMI